MPQDPQSDQEEVHDSDSGVPDEPSGSPLIGEGVADDGRHPPLGELPTAGFWETLYERRSIRKFKQDPVPRKLIEQVMHAGIWAPSSCNYQMWDLIAVDDADMNAQLTKLSLQMGNAPVNIVVAYGRHFSEENWANIQSASALIQNMSLAAQALGLGTFWITQMGEREKLRELVGLPADRLVVAVLALGYAQVVPKRGPKRRPLGQVAHYNHYAGRPIPSSARPDDWTPDLLAIYQRARVLNGLRHNKPRAWEVGALDRALEELLPEVSGRWLDVLPCTGILTDLLCKRRPGQVIDVIERTPEVAEFVSKRTRPQGAAFCWQDEHGPGPEGEGYDVITCLYRLEGLCAEEREQLLGAMAGWVAPGGKLLIGFVSARSFHNLTEKVRSRGKGPQGVEYVLAPDPNIGPFAPLDGRCLERACAAAGLRVVRRLGLQAVPQLEELAFRTRNFSPRRRAFGRGLGQVFAALEKLPGVQARWGRFQYLLLERG